MKVNLLLNNPGDVLSGYLNIDPLAPADCQDGRVRADVSNLDAVVDAAEADVIVARDILDYFPGSAVDGILSNWLSKLAKGGALTLSVVDIAEVSRAIIHNKLTIEEANRLIYGSQEQDWQLKKSGYTLGQVSEVLSNRGFKILARRIHNYRAIVTCQRSKE